MDVRSDEQLFGITSSMTYQHTGVPFELVNQMVTREWDRTVADESKWYYAATADECASTIAPSETC